jgi:hypothetical protein
MIRDTAKDEIIAEVRAARDRLAARFGYDPGRLYEEAKRREEASDREKLAAAPKRIEPAASS